MTINTKRGMIIITNNTKYTGEMHSGVTYGLFKIKKHELEIYKTIREKMDIFEKLMRK